MPGRTLLNSDSSHARVETNNFEMKLLVYFFGDPVLEKNSLEGLRAGLMVVIG